MTLSAYLALGGGITGIIGVLFGLWQRAKRQASDAAKDQAVADLAAAETAAASERARQAAGATAFAVEDWRYKAGVEEWLRSAHPELGPEYLGLCVRLAVAAGAAGAAVPGPGAAGPG